MPRSSLETLAAERKKCLASSVSSRQHRLRLLSRVVGHQNQMCRHGETHQGQTLPIRGAIPCMGLTRMSTIKFRCADA